MRRREVVLLGGVSLWLGLGSAEAKTYRIAFLGNSYDAALWQAFLEGLRDHGWVESPDFIIERRWAEGRPERLPGLASELVSLNSDVIVAAAPPAVRAAQEATRTTPIIMTAVSDPVAAGFVSRLSAPGGNITGVASTAGAGLLSKLLELARDALPTASRVGILFNEANPLNYVAPAKPEILEAARALRLEVSWLPVTGTADFDPAFQSAKERNAEAVIGIGDPLLFRERQHVHRLAEKHSVPTIWPTREYLAEQGLLSHGPSLPGMLRHAAAYVDKMLRGGDPASTPVEQPTRYELVVNLRAARRLGLTIPPTLLARADEVIE